MIDRITNASRRNHPDSIQSGKGTGNRHPLSPFPLHKLHTLHIPDPYEQHRPFTTNIDDSDLLTQFTALPSLRTVVADLRSDFDIEARASPSAAVTSWLQNLTIQCHNVATVQPLIPQLHHLRSLSLTERGGLQRVDEGPILQWMLDDLAVAAGHSLEELRLSSKLPYAKVPTRRKAVENLMGFEKLRVLDVDGHFLAGLDRTWESAGGQVVPSSLEWVRLGMS